MLLSKILRRILLHIDRQICRQLNMIEYWDHQDSILRVCIQNTGSTLIISNTTVPKGTKVIDLHFWNERFPIITTEKNVSANPTTP